MTTNHPEAGEKIFKKGEVIYQQGDYVTAIFDVLWGQVALYVDYHKPTQRLLNEVEADGFFGIVGFLESRPQNATAVAPSGRSRHSRAASVIPLAARSIRRRPVLRSPLMVV